jgi:hypothetical protein
VRDLHSTASIGVKLSVPVMLLRFYRWAHDHFNAY